MKSPRWNNITIGGKYGIIFFVMLTAFLTSVLITYGLLKDTSQTVQDTKSKNETAVQSAKLMSLYQNKYLHIPEYIINAQDEKLTDYMKYSQEFADTAKKLKKELHSDEQLDMFDQIIENNHSLDEYFFSEIVPNVQQINTEKFLTLQKKANKLKEETMTLGESLKENAVKTNVESIGQAQSNMTKTIYILGVSILISAIVSAGLLIIVSRQIKKSLKRVVAASEEIAKGHLNFEALDYKGKDEIGQLSQAVNHMGGSLREMIVKYQGSQPKSTSNVLRLRASRLMSEKEANRSLSPLKNWQTGPRIRQMKQLIFPSRHRSSPGKFSTLMKAAKRWPGFQKKCFTCLSTATNRWLNHWSK
uniref:HAMP domain-containing protein n=1 Tax=Bacillus licheniformis TaxID=1402 RepID=UPI002930FAA5|nr:HAMP domain-containing protein [Bacillus licheniformis]